MTVEQCDGRTLLGCPTPAFFVHPVPVQGPSVPFEIPWHVLVKNRRHHNCTRGPPLPGAPVVFRLSLPVLTLWSLFGDAKTDALPLTINVHLSLHTDRSLFGVFMPISSERYMFWDPCTCPRRCLKSEKLFE